MAAILVGNWWALALRGALAILFAIIAFALPLVAATAMVLVFAAYAFVDGIFALIAESARRSGRQNFIDRAEKLRNLTYDDALRGNVLVGTPDSVSRKLMQLRDEIGFEGILAELNCGGLIPHDRVLNAIRVLCQEVLPRFR
jgi:alkanesulfonate monooxygenase SsuD/methylene tetrahydromethanopterin reductase-like flavin-dependent oxidoreductase (luciferase family)